MSAVDKTLLKAARTAERSGEVERAARLYQRAGAALDAGRLLAGLQRFGEATQVLITALGVQPEQVGALGRAGKKLGLQAALYATKAKQHALAAKLYRALGKELQAEQAQALANQAEVLRREQQQQISQGDAEQLERAGQYASALDAYLRLGRHDDAGRMAMEVGRPEEAGALYAKARNHLMAAACYLEAGLDQECLAQLLLVPKRSEDYGDACLSVVRLADELDMLSFRVEHFLSDYIDAGPQSASDLETFYRLGHIYLSSDLPEAAQRVFKQIVKANSIYRDAAELVSVLEAELMSGAMGAFQDALEQDNAFRDVGQGSPQPEEGFPDLPDLPDLPSLPPAPQIAPPQAAPPQAAPPQAAPPQAAPPQAVPPQAAPVLTPLQAAPPPAAPVLTPLQAAPPPAAPVLTPLQAGPPPAAPVLTPLQPAPPPAEPSQAAPSQAAPSQEAASPASSDAAVPAARTTRQGAPSIPVSFNTLPELIPGAIIVGRYRIEQQLGSGGSAAIFHAVDLELDEPVALKIMKRPDATSIAYERFRRELKLTRQLAHPNVIRVYDIGVQESFAFISMELLVGRTLLEVMREPIPLTDKLAYLIQACAGLQAAHDMEVIHRDVKPENFFITEANVLKVMDFGIAKHVRLKGVTEHGLTVGTPEYMAPEQIRGNVSLSAETDLYSLGVMAYELFTGQLPFTHTEMMPLLMMHLEQTPEPPRKFNPGLPQPLERIVLQLLAKTPADRYPSCKALGRELRLILQEYRNDQR